MGEPEIRRESSGLDPEQPEHRIEIPEHSASAPLLGKEQGSGELKRVFEATSSDAVELPKPGYQSSSPVESLAHTPHNRSPDDYSRYSSLYEAIQKADWVSAETFIDQHEDALTARISGFTRALYWNQRPGSIDFLKKLLDKMPPEALKLCDPYGKTALHNAIISGNDEVAKVIVQKDISLLYVRASDNGYSAFDHAAFNGSKDIFLYLMAVTKDEPFSNLFPNENCAARLLKAVIGNGWYGRALFLVERYSSLATSVDENGNWGLKTLATHTSAFKSGSHYRWWQRIIYSLPCIENVPDPEALKLLKRLCAGVRSLNDSGAFQIHVTHALHLAAKFGNLKVVEEIVGIVPYLKVVEEIVGIVPYPTYCNLLWAKHGEAKENVFQVAAANRHLNVYKFLCDRLKWNRPSDDSENNALHIAAKLAPPNENNLVIGAALYMQSELRWFEDVKKNMIYESFWGSLTAESLNRGKETTTMVFIKDHEKLRADGEQWMKGTANSLTIPATLIITVVFAAAITVPGGLHQSGDDEGLPLFAKEVVFNIFAIFDAISLCASITSLLVSLSILTSRYAYHEFLFALPNKLVIALFTLFLSITTMAVAFSSALYIMFGSKDKALILCLVFAVAIIPIISFALLQFRLLLDLMVSTYGPRIFKT